MTVGEQIRRALARVDAWTPINSPAALTASSPR
jgi:hypothetical protein